MPRGTPGYKTISTEVREELMNALAELVKQTGRTLRDEINHAIARHVEQPPRIVAPPLKQAAASPSTETRGRKPKKQPPGES